MRVAAMYALRLLGCWFDLFVIAAVVAVDDIMPPIAPEASTPPRLPSTFESIYHMYSTPAMMTTNNHIPNGLKKCIDKTSWENCIWFPVKNWSISRIENFVFGSRGNMTSDITANFSASPSSVRENRSRIFLRYSFDERITSMRMASMTAIVRCPLSVITPMR